MRWVICAAFSCSRLRQARSRTTSSTSCAAPNRRAGDLYALGRLLWRRPGRLFQRQRQFLAVRRSRCSRSACAAADARARSMQIPQWIPVLGNGSRQRDRLRRLRRLQYAVGGSDPRHRSELYAHAHFQRRVGARATSPIATASCGRRHHLHCRPRRHRVAWISRTIGSFAARAGWVVGNLLPYGFAGFALGRGKLQRRHADVTASRMQPPTRRLPCTAAHTVDLPRLTSFRNSAGQNNALLYGFAVGGGLDWALTPNVFRARRIRIHPVRAGRKHQVSISRPPASAPASSSKPDSRRLAISRPCRRTSRLTARPRHP